MLFFYGLILTIIRYYLYFMKEMIGNNFKTFKLSTSTVPLLLKQNSTKKTIAERETRPHISTSLFLGSSKIKRISPHAPSSTICR